MRPGNLLFSAVQFIFVVVVLSLGAFLIGLANAPLLRSAIATMFLEKSALFTFLGVMLLIIGLLLLLGFYSMQRGRYLSVEMKDRKTQIEIRLVKEYVEKYWKNTFPDQDVHTEVLIYPNQKIELSLQIPNLSFEEQQAVLEKVEKELGDLFAKKLGYNREFVCNLIVK